MVDLSSTVGVALVQTAVLIFDLLTFPIYYVAQRPWQAVAGANAIRAVRVDDGEDGGAKAGEATWEPVPKMTPLLDEFIKAGIKTMDECFEFAVRKHSHRRMVGTRQVLSETDEVQSNGKVFQKWEMGEYRWKSYLEVDVKARDFGWGLRQLGLEPRRNICIFAETKEEWLMCALGCFKQNFPLVTLYANLGEVRMMMMMMTFLLTSKILLIRKTNFCRFSWKSTLSTGIAP